MMDWIEQTEDMVYKGRIKVPYTWWVGETSSHFFATLRDEKKLMGTFCSKCDMVFMPPRKNCGRCFNQELSWKEVADEGTLLTYTVPAYEADIHPMKPPFAFGIIKLDGADTGLTHIVTGFGAGQLKAGLRVKAVFKEDREGHILDIHHFQPV